MDAFSYLSVLLSIILGLAITQLLQGLGLLLQARRRVRWDWAICIWIAALLLLFVQSWWASFELRNISAWSFGAFSIVLLQTVIEFLLAALLLPPVPSEGPVDLVAAFDSNGRALYFSLVALIGASLAKSFVLSGSLPAWGDRADTASHVAFAALSLAGGLGGPRLRRALAPVFLGGMLVYIAVLFPRLR